MDYHALILTPQQQQRGTTLTITIVNGVVTSSTTLCKSMMLSKMSSRKGIPPKILQGLEVPNLISMEIGPSQFLMLEQMLEISIITLHNIRGHLLRIGSFTIQIRA